MVPAGRATEGVIGLAAHEVKTAATSVRGYAQLLLRQLDRTGSVDTDRLHRAMRTIEQQAEHIGRLMDQLLDVGRIDAGTFTLRRAPVDLSQLLRDALQAPRRRAGRHELRLDLPAAPVVADVDEHRLQEALANLLDNALKFGPPTTPIDVTLRAVPVDTITITVADRGPGVPGEHRDRLFERFFQLHGEGFQAGMGLGLYLSREIVRRHGGDITADFPPQGGATFTITLPHHTKID
ncbi:MAG TPA: HAMP domain-containing sensor histidine kinase [Dongiaceae bacterium]